MSSANIRALPKQYSTFTPTVIPSCALWIDAADTNTITLSGSNVTAVRDKVQNISLTTQGTSSLLTLSNAINSKQTLYFNNSAGNSVYLQGTFANLLTGSFFVVWRAAAQLSAEFRALYAWQSQGGLRFPVFGYVNSLTVVAPYTTFVGAGTPTTTVAAGTNYLTFYSWTGTTTNVGFNGATPTAGTQGAYASSSSVFTIMGEIGSSLATCTGYIGEMIFYNTVLSASQRQEVEGYLAQKWGVTAGLPATHPYKSLPLFTRPFLPNEIENCALWLDAADIRTLSLTGTNVTQWRDKSGNGRNTTAVTGTPTWTSNSLNGLPGIYFNGSQDMTGPFVYASNVLTYFIVSTTESDTTRYGRTLAIGTSGVSDFNSINSMACLARDTSGNLTYLQRNNSAVNVSNQTYATPFLWSGLVDGTNCTALLNGTSSGSFASSGNFSTAIYTLSIGLPTSSALRNKGFIYEIVMYTAALTAPQRHQVEGYLSWKWGLQNNLPSGQPFKLFRTPSTLFTPLSLSNCGLWLDAADSTTITLSSGSNVSSWGDKSGNARNATVVSPITTSSNNIVFNGTGYLTLNLDFLSNVSHFAFVVCSNTNFANIYGAITPGNGANSLHVGFQNSTTHRMNYWGNDYYQTITSNYKASQRNLLEYFWNRNTSKTIYANGGLEGTSNQAGIIGTMSGGGTIGNAVAQGIYQGSINEIVFYTSASGNPLTTLQRQQVEGYLAWKWGLRNNLSSNHPYYITRP